MKISIGHSFINIDINEDEQLFYYLSYLAHSNFMKKIGKKNKIIIFSDENEDVQKRYFLKLISKIYKRLNNLEIFFDINEQKKPIRLNLSKKNQIQRQVIFQVGVSEEVIYFKSDSKNRLLSTFVKHHFRDHLVQYRLKYDTVFVYPNNILTFEKLDELVCMDEISGCFVKFEQNSGELRRLKNDFQKKEFRKKRFRAVFDLISDKFSILNCPKGAPFELIRQNYLSLAKKYHPDCVGVENHKIILEYTQKFQEIQQAYRVIKDLYAHEKLIAA